MTDNANKPSDRGSDRSESQSDKTSKNLAKGTPELSNSNLRNAQRANLNRTDTVSPDGKPRFTLTDEKQTGQGRATQEQAYRAAGMGDPDKAVGQAKSERMQSRAENWDIAAQIKDGIKDLNKNHEDTEVPGQSSHRSGILDERLAQNQIDHPESAPIQLPNPEIAKTLEHTGKAAYKLEDGAVEFSWKAFDRARVDSKVNEQSTWEQVDLNACNTALMQFPELRKYGVDSEVIAGIILNEVAHRDAGDDKEDAQIRKAGKVSGTDGEESLTASIGPAQIQVRNIKQLVEKFPKQLEDVKSDPCRAALEPSKAPLFVAAYLQEKLDGFSNYDRKHPNERIPKCYESLLYTYNPDVVSNSNGEYRSISSQEKALTKAASMFSGHPEKSPTLKDWKSEFTPRNLQILHASSVVKDIKYAIEAVKNHKQ